MVRFRVPYRGRLPAELLRSWLPSYPIQGIRGARCGCRHRGAPETIRTSDQRFRKPLLYPAELRGQSQSSYPPEPQTVNGLSLVLDAQNDVHRPGFQSSLAVESLDRQQK